MLMNVKRTLARSALFLGVSIMLASTAAAFTSDNGTGSGPLTIGAGFTFTPAASGPSFGCTGFTGGAWKIREGSKEVESSKGTRENFSGQYTKCSVLISKAVPFSVNSGCELQAVRVTATKATATVTAACVVAVEGCEVTLGSLGSNTGLKEILTVPDHTKAQEIAFHVSGITSSVKEPECADIGVKGGKEGELKEVFLASEQKTS
jgi:hypothetical protein